MVIGKRPGEPVKKNDFTQYRPSLIKRAFFYFMMRYIAILIFIFLQGCSLFEVEVGTNESLKDYKRYEKKDYLKSLEIIGNDYIEQNSKKIVKLPSRHQKFLQKILTKIQNNNELLFKKKSSNYSIYLVKDQRAFHFSMPKRKIFLSVGLIKRYLQNEEFFTVILLGESLRLEKDLFKKEIVIPTGSLRVDKLIALSRLSSKLNLELSKYIYLALERSGYDPFVSLLWIQSKNKNAIDFSLLYRDVSQIALEEQGLKTFIIKREKEIKFRNEEKVVSKDFYRLLSFVESLKS